MRWKRKRRNCRESRPRRLFRKFCRHVWRSAGSAWKESHVIAGLSSVADSGVASSVSGRRSAYPVLPKSARSRTEADPSPWQRKSHFSPSSVCSSGAATKRTFPSAFRDVQSFRRLPSSLPSEGATQIPRGRQRRKSRRLIPRCFESHRVGWPPSSPSTSLPFRNLRA